MSYSSTTASFLISRSSFSKLSNIHTSSIERHNDLEDLESQSPSWSLDVRENMHTIISEDEFLAAYTLAGIKTNTTDANYLDSVNGVERASAYYESSLSVASGTTMGSRYGDVHTKRGDTTLRYNPLHGASSLYSAGTPPHRHHNEIHKQLVLPSSHDLQKATKTAESEQQCVEHQHPQTLRTLHGKSNSKTSGSARHRYITKRVPEAVKDRKKKRAPLPARSLYETKDAYSSKSSVAHDQTLVQKNGHNPQEDECTAMVPDVKYLPSGKTGFILRSVRGSKPIETLINPNITENISLQHFSGEAREKSNHAKSPALGRRHGRPLSEKMTCCFCPIQSICDIVDPGTTTQEQSTMVSFMDPSSTVQPIDPNTYRNDEIDKVIKQAVCTDDYHFIQVIRTTRNISRAPKSGSKEPPILKFVEIPAPGDPAELTVGFLKKTVAYPRYKAGMKIYVMPGKIRNRRWFYTSTQLMNQENIQILAGKIRIVEPIAMYGPDSALLRAVVRPDSGASTADQADDANHTKGASPFYVINLGHEVNGIFDSKLETYSAREQLISQL